MVSIIPKTVLLLLLNNNSTKSICIIKLSSWIRPHILAVVSHNKCLGMSALVPSMKETGIISNTKTRRKTYWNCFISAYISWMGTVSMECIIIISVWLGASSVWKTLATWFSSSSTWSHLDIWFLSLTTFTTTYHPMLCTNWSFQLEESFPTLIYHLPNVLSFALFSSMYPYLN